MQKKDLKKNVKEQHLEHAKHIERVSNFISKKVDFSDWVVITSFYSALHFVSHKIFPKRCKTDDGHLFTVESIGHYRNTHNLDYDKHTVLQILVEEEMPEISREYTRLREISQSARYTDHKVNRELATLARGSLKRIKAVCVQPLPKAG